MKNCKYLFSAMLLTALTLVSCKQAKESKKDSLKIESLSWLQGSWLTADSTTVETWAIQNGEVAGNAYSQAAGKITETLRIFDDKGIITYEATVIDQNNGAPIKFPLESYGPYSLFFVNMNHDFPNFIVYKKLSDSTIYAKVYGKTDRGFTSTMKKLSN